MQETQTQTTIENENHLTLEQLEEKIQNTTKEINSELSMAEIGNLGIEERKLLYVEKVKPLKLKLSRLSELYNNVITKKHLSKNTNRITGKPDVESTKEELIALINS